MSEVPSLYPALRAQVPETEVLMLSKATLVEMSHAIEDIVLEQGLEAVVFTGFQKSSYWYEEIARYRQMAHLARNVCIFARGDCQIADSVHLNGVSLAEGDGLAQEWFLLVLTREISVMLCGKDCASPAAEESERLFATLWTLDPAEISACLGVLVEAVDRYRPDLSAQVRSDLAAFAPVRPDPAHLTRLMQRMARFQERANVRLRTANLDLEKRVAERTTELEQALVEREAFFVQLQDLIYTIAHDVRTPLLATDLVLRRALEGFYGRPPAALQSLLEDIRRSDRQLLDLTENLLRIARLEANAEQLDRAPLDLAPLLAQATQDLAALAAEKSVRIDTHLVPAEVLGNASELRRVFINLLDNAIKFSPTAGRIEVTLTTQDGTVQASVRDEGPGMDLEDQQMLFERFWQGKKRQLGKGTGLGLYLSSRLIAALGGTITVSSAPGEGSTFTVSLPASEDER